MKKKVVLAILIPAAIIAILLILSFMNFSQVTHLADVQERRLTCWSMDLSNARTKQIFGNI